MGIYCNELLFVYMAFSEFHIGKFPMSHKELCVNVRDFPNAIINVPTCKINEYININVK